MVAVLTKNWKKSIKKFTVFNFVREYLINGKRYSATQQIFYLACIVDYQKQKNLCSRPISVDFESFNSANVVN